MKYSYNKMRYAAITLSSLYSYEIYYSCKKDDNRMSLRYYVEIQIVKVEILYLLLKQTRPDQTRPHLDLSSATEIEVRDSRSPDG